MFNILTLLNKNSGDFLWVFSEFFFFFTFSLSLVISFWDLKNSWISFWKSHPIKIVEKLSIIRKETPWDDNPNNVCRFKHWNEYFSLFNPRNYVSCSCFRGIERNILLIYVSISEHLILLTWSLHDWQEIMWVFCMLIWVSQCKVRKMSNFAMLKSCEQKKSSCPKKCPQVVLRNFAHPVPLWQWWQWNVRSSDKNEIILRWNASTGTII